MRSITFISMLGLANIAGAQITDGCFGRAYSAEHLDRNSAQHVRSLLLRFYSEPEVQLAELLVKTRDVEGASAGGDFHDRLYCGQFDGQPGCGIECDGGSFAIIDQNDTQLAIETRYLRLSNTDSEGCNGFSDLSEQGKMTRYLLEALPATACDIVFGHLEGS